jgi:hypothetical protein
MSDKEAQGYLAKAKQIILAADYQPAIGEIQEYAGLPLKVVRYASRAEYEECRPFPFPVLNEPDDGSFYFQVEVAD